MTALTRWRSCSSRWHHSSTARQAAPGQQHLPQRHGCSSSRRTATVRRCRSGAARCCLHAPQQQQQQLALACTRLCKVVSCSPCLCGCGAQTTASCPRARQTWATCCRMWIQCWWSQQCSQQATVAEAKARQAAACASRRRAAETRARMLAVAPPAQRGRRQAAMSCSGAQTHCPGDVQAAIGCTRRRGSWDSGCDAPLNFNWAPGPH